MRVSICGFQLESGCKTGRMIRNRIMLLQQLWLLSSRFDTAISVCAYKLMAQEFGQIYYYNIL